MTEQSTLHKSTEWCRYLREKKGLISTMPSEARNFTAIADHITTITAENERLSARVARLEAELDEARFNAAAIKGLWETRRKTIATITTDNERLSARIERLEAALKPFASVAEHDIGESEDDVDKYQPMPTQYARGAVLTVGDFRTARRELEEGHD